jgi:hypothetical protein
MDITVTLLIVARRTAITARSGSTAAASSAQAAGIRDRHFMVNPRFGYHGAYPARGSHFDNRDFHDFHGTHYSDHQGHYHTEAQHSHYTGGDHHR